MFRMLEYRSQHTHTHTRMHDSNYCLSAHADGLYPAPNWIINHCRGYNKKVQNNDPTSHEETDTLKNFGRRRSYEG